MPLHVAGGGGGLLCSELQVPKSRLCDLSACG